MNSGYPKYKSTEVSLLKQRTTLSYQRFRLRFVVALSMSEVILYLPS